MTAPARHPGERAWNILGCALIACAALVVYSRTFSAPFVLDAEPIVTRYPSIRHLWPIWDALRPPHDGSTVEGRPALNFSLAISYALGGTRPWAYHAMNLAIHILAGLTLFGIVRRSLLLKSGRRKAESGSPGTDAVPNSTSVAFAVALLWTVHPLQTESVTYIIQRAESLMGLFYLLTLYCFIRGTKLGESENRKAKSEDAKSLPAAEKIPLSAFRFSIWPAHLKPQLACPAWFGLSFIACLLGMATKEVMVSAPVIVFLYDRTFVAGSFGEAWRRRRAYYIALAATWIFLGVLMIGTGNRQGTAGFGAHLPWLQYALTQIYAVGRYLRLAFWPHPLVFDYGSAVITRASAILPSALVLVALFAGTGAGLCARGATARIAGFLGACFFAILAPTCLVPVATQTMAEHRMYLPLAALVTGFVLILGYASRRLSSAFRFSPFAFLPACLLLAAATGAATMRRNAVYGSATDLWADTVAAWPSNARAHTQLGKALFLSGQTEPAAVQFRLSLALQPFGNEDAYYDLGNCLVKERRFPEAIENLEKAVVLKPGNPDAHNSLGNALADSGRPYEAVRQYRAALEDDPGDSDAQNNLGLVLGQLGRLQEAIGCYEAALRSKPEFPEAQCNLGAALAAEGRFGEALGHFEASLRLKPDDVTAHFNLGNALARLGRLSEAIAHYMAALRLAPGYAQAHDNLGNALLQEGRLAEAISHYEEAVRLEPDYARAHFNLGNALLRSGRIAEAAEQFAVALRLQPDMEEARAMLARVRPAGAL